MVKIIAGEEGTGKTKKLIQLANEKSKSAKGSVFFIDDDSRNIFELGSRIRFINLEDFLINNSEVLYGFICGLINCDYDMESLYIDGIDYLNDLEPEKFDEFIESINELSKNNSLEIVLCLNKKLDSFSQKSNQYII